MHEYWQEISALTMRWVLRLSREKIQHALHPRAAHVVLADLLRKSVPAGGRFPGHTGAELH